MEREVLVIMPHNPGDVVMALFVVERIQRSFGPLRLDYLVSEECQDLVIGHPCINQVFILPRKQLVEFWTQGDCSGVLDVTRSFITRLRENEYCFSLNLFQEKIGGWIQGMVVAREKSGLEFNDGVQYTVHGRHMEHLFAIPANRSQNSMHVVDLYFRAAARILERIFPGRRRCPGPPLTDRILSIGSFPQNFPFLAREYLVVHLGSAWAGKRWPLEHWTELCRILLEGGRKIVLTGAQVESSLARQMVEELPAAELQAGQLLNCVGATTLIEAAALIGSASLVVTGDTVAMHLAAAQGTWSICLFGASNPVETGPYGPGHLVLQGETTLPSALELSRTHAGLRKISPEFVAHAIWGTMPPSSDDCRIWNTRWDADNDMQILTDWEGHPHQWHEGRERLLFLLEEAENRSERLPRCDPAHLPDACSSNLSEETFKLLRGLEDMLRSASYNPSEMESDRLEEMEKRLAELTADQIIWESYRIAINGLPLQNLACFFQNRLDRLNQAIEEAQFLSKP